MEFRLNEYGYITNYLVSGRKETSFSSEITDEDQLVCERLMRGEVADHDEKMPEGEIKIGSKSALGMPWNYVCSYGNWFVDMSTFYPLLTKVEFHGATMLNAPADMTVEIWLWSYAAVDLWVNEGYQGGIKTPVYKPINRKVLEIPLKKGQNLIYIRLQNLGVRDTRSLFGLQIPGREKDILTVTLPDAQNVEPYAAADGWLSGTILKNDTLLFPSQAPEGSRIVYDARPVDFLDYPDRYTDQELHGEREVCLKEGCPYVVLEVLVQGQKLTRAFERQEILAPVYSSRTANNEARIYERIASVGQIPRGDLESFSMYPVLARYYMGSQTLEDEKEIYKSFDQIESRRDCSDFLTCAMVRFMKLYPMKAELALRCKEVMLNYRYWMDEEGNDGMCFWSENHSLMFFVSAYLAGDTYPEDIFVRSGRTGHEMKQIARKRIYDWMKETEEGGFDEFHSGGYSPITFAAILNVVDFGDEELSGLAWRVADRLLEELSVQTFKGVSIAPMGRVYREVLYPYMQDIQCLVNLMDPQTPDRFSEWIIFLATSKYQVSEELKDRWKEPVSVIYHESNARICVEKHKDYMLTSVQSPRTDKKARSWEHISNQPGMDKGSFAYVKSLNECFHGTTQFEPGVFGYQQHMWYAALDPAAVVFVNHPGGSCETCSTRPGYWFGNGIMPALKQEKEVLLGIYQIPETHPIPFTHLYWPQSRFEEQRMEGGWLVGKASGGYIGVWCSEHQKPYDDQLSACEYRAEGRNTAYVCVCKSQDEYPELGDFFKACTSMEPVYDKEVGYLSAGGQELRYVACENRTQYI